MKKEDSLKPYDAKKSVWVPNKEDGGYDEGLIQVSSVKYRVTRVANDSRPGWLMDSKIMVELNILVVILCHDHAVVVN